MTPFWYRALLFAGIALALPACGGSSSGSSPSTTAVSAFSDPGIETFPDEGHTHVPVGTALSYATDPPNSGSHYPYPRSGGYSESPIAPGFLVHSMEHGAVIFYYDSALVTADQKNSLKALALAHPGTFSQVVCTPRNDGTYPLILTAWTHRLRLTVYDQARIDGFLALFLGNGPEGAPESPWGDPQTMNTTATDFVLSTEQLQVSDTARPGSMFTNTGMTYPSESTTVNIDLKLTAISALADTQTVQIRDGASGSVVAQAVYDASSGQITFSIGGTTFSSSALSTNAFNTVTFTLDAARNATWSVGGTATSPPTAIASESVTVGLDVSYLSGSGPAPDFYFSNLVVTGP